MKRRIQALATWIVGMCVFTGVAFAASPEDFAHEQNTKAPEGASAGAGGGAVLGGALGWLAGIGALALPGVGPLIAAGPSWRR